MLNPLSLLRLGNETVERVVAAPPATVFDLLADPSRHREIDGSGTVRTAPASRLSLGARFTTDMKAGISYQMVNTVVEFEQDRRIAWQPRPSVSALTRLIGGRIWRYELEPAPGGTRVRETWDISQEAVPALIAPLRALTRRNMTRTLDRLAETVA